MAERGPQGYQYKHHKTVFLDEYRGVASDIIEVNDPIADGFMQRADIRGDIVITQNLPRRTLDYDQVGTVRVGKFLRIPHIGREESLTSVDREDGVWYIGINDQDLAQKVSRTDPGKKFDGAYVTAFGQEVRKGMTEVLKREKLFNGGEFNQATLWGYFWLLCNTATALQVELNNLADTTDISKLVSDSATNVFAYSYFNFAMNVINLGMAYSTKKYPISSFDSHPDDPFIKSSFPEYLMLTVPIDRYIRGSWYLKKNGEKMINRVQ